MDDKRRERLREALRMLTSAEQIVDVVCDKEQDCMENYPENLQGTERYEQMEEAVDSLNDALEKIDDAKSSIESVIK
jgi:hypothetical protein